MAELKIKSKLHNEEDILEFNKEEANSELGTPTEAQITTLAKSAIQADKDILSQIVYDSETPSVIFPKGIMPLRIVLSDTEYYFDYIHENLLDYAGKFVQNRGIELQDKSVVIDADFSETHIVQIEYMFFNNYYGPLNAFYFYNPITSAGTKLYKHILDFTDGGADCSFYVISTSSQPITLSFLESDALDVGINCISISKEIQGEVWLFAPFNVSYDSAGLELTALLSNMGSGGDIEVTVTFNSTPTLTDTVTEL